MAKLCLGMLLATSGWFLNCGFNDIDDRAVSPLSVPCLPIILRTRISDRGIMNLWTINFELNLGPSNQFVSLR